MKLKRSKEDKVRFRMMKKSETLVLHVVLRSLEVIIEDNLILKSQKLNEYTEPTFLLISLILTLITLV